MDRGHSHTPGVQRPWSILGIGAPGLAGALRHSSFMARSASLAPNLLRSVLRNSPARRTPSVSPWIIGRASLSEIRCKAAVASPAEIRPSGLPKSRACQNALISGGIGGGGAGDTCGTLCEGPVAITEGIEARGPVLISSPGSSGNALWARSRQWFLSEASRKQNRLAI
jgi:hypothetical protein